MIELKRFGKAALVTVLSVSFFLPSDTLAANSQQSSNTVAPATLLLDSTFAELSNRSFADLQGIYITTPTKITLNVTQRGNGAATGTPVVSYKIMKPHYDGTATSYGSERFEGTGAFSFTSTQVLPPGEYYIRVNNSGVGKVSGSVKVTTP